MFVLVPEPIFRSYSVSTPGGTDEHARTGAISDFLGPEDQGLLLT